MKSSQRCRAIVAVPLPLNKLTLIALHFLIIVKIKNIQYLMTFDCEIHTHFIEYYRPKNEKENPIQT